MNRLRELSNLSLTPVSARPGEPIVFGKFSDYVQLGDERIYVRVTRGEIIMAEAPPDFGQPNVNRKWIAGKGMVGLELAVMHAAAD